MKKFLQDLILPSFWVFFFVIFSPYAPKTNQQKDQGESGVANIHTVSSIEYHSISEKKIPTKGYNLEEK
jgi:hypothetical protein